MPQVLHREAPGLVRRQREWEELRARAFVVLSTGGKKGETRDIGLGLATSSNFRRLWGTGAISSWYLTLGCD